jgi:hypothetical protein
MMTSPAGPLLDALRANDKHADWLEHLDGLGDSEFPIELPDDAEMASILRELEVPEEDIPAAIASRPDRERQPDAWWLLERSVVALVSTMGGFDAPQWFPSPYTVPGMNPFFFVHVFLATLPHTRRHHRKRGIPDDIARATLADLGRNVRVNRKRYGEGGLEVSHWLMLHFRGMIYQLGRLQFERTKTWGAIVSAASALGEDASPQDFALSIHIPDFMGPMTPEACDASFEWAREFFATYFPDEPYRRAVCSSWLLDPHLKDYLSPSSNIVRFQDRFEIAEGGRDSDTTVLQFVFGSAPDDLTTLPQRSSLERAVVTHLQNGGHWQFRPGWFTWP